MPRVLDDGTFATLSSLMLFNNVEVLMALTQVHPAALAALLCMFHSIFALVLVLSMRASFRIVPLIISAREQIVL